MSQMFMANRTSLHSTQWLFHVFITALIAIVLTACEPPPPEAAGTPSEMKRLSESQYRAIIADVFGEQISIAGRFDPLKRIEGLKAIGAKAASVTPFGLEEYGRMARSIAAQVVNSDNRAVLIPCASQDQSQFNKTCADEFLTRVSTLLFRRPLEDSEWQLLAVAVQQSFDIQGDFFGAIASGIEWLLMSPSFLFIVEDTEIAEDGNLVLTDYAIASRLSFLLWNSGPDSALIRAAQQGKLKDEEIFQEQVDRMIASPRFEQGVRAFFSDMLDLEKTDVTQKDAIIFPLFNAEVLVDSREQVLKDLYSHLVVERQGYPDIFTLRKTYVSPALARIYQVPAPQNMAWFQHEFDERDARIGIQSQVSFVALHSHPGRSSPTLRGAAIRELLLCQTVPDPPADVDFSLFIGNMDEEGLTTRDRLDIHNESPACAGCHRLTDPIGLALERFDGDGGYRTKDNGTPIDPSGALDGITFEDSNGLGRALKANAGAPQCAANRLFTYALGRPATNDDREYLNYISAKFAEDGYDFVELVRRIVTSSTFLKVAANSDSIS